LSESPWPKRKGTRKDGGNNRRLGASCDVSVRPGRWGDPVLDRVSQTSLGGALLSWSVCGLWLMACIEPGMLGVDWIVLAGVRG